MSTITTEILSQLSTIEDNSKETLIAMANYKAIKAHTAHKPEFEALHKWLSRNPALHHYIILLQCMRQAKAEA